MPLRFTQNVTGVHPVGIAIHAKAVVKGVNNLNMKPERKPAALQ